jgi:hypothetical protein
MSKSSNPDCRDIEQNLAAYVDGECAAAERSTVDAHLNACARCRMRVIAERAAHELVQARRDSLRVCAPDRLRQRCAGHRTTGRRLAKGAAPRPWLSLSVAATMVFAAVVVLFFGWGSSAETYAAQLAADHIKCFQFPPHPMVRDATAIGRAWEAAHGWPLKLAVDNEDEQLHFVGLRRCGSTKGRVAHLLYRWREEPLSVYVLNRTLDTAPHARDQGETYPSIVKLGERAVIWSERGRTYAIVARRSPQELEQIARLVRRDIE